MPSLSTVLGGGERAESQAGTASAPVELPVSLEVPADTDVSDEAQHVEYVGREGARLASLGCADAQTCKEDFPLRNTPSVSLTIPFSK